MARRNWPNAEVVNGKSRTARVEAGHADLHDIIPRFFAIWGTLGVLASAH